MAPIRMQLAKAVVSAFPFVGYRIAKLTFRNVKDRLILSRPFASRRLYIDVSRSPFQQMLYLEGERAIHDRHLLTRLVRPGTHVVDVGSNIGYITLLLHRAIGPAGRITCIEPSPENLTELKMNIEANRLSNVTLHECALGSADGKTGLRSGINSGIVNIDEGAYSSELRQLDSLITHPVDFIKIDVDGYEGQVLSGAVETIRRDRPSLLIEFHPKLVKRHHSSFAQIMEFLLLWYRDIEFYDVPEKMSLLRKVSSRMFGRDSVRRVDPSKCNEDQLHVGRMYGTFWIACHTKR